MINVRRLNASRMCSFASFRCGPDNYYPAPLEDMRAQLSDIYHIIYIYIYICHIQRTGLIAFPLRIFALTRLSSCFRVSLDESVEFIRLRSRHMTSRPTDPPAYIINGNPKDANGRLRLASSGTHLST